MLVNIVIIVIIIAVFIFLMLRKKKQPEINIRKVIADNSRNLYPELYNKLHDFTLIDEQMSNFGFTQTSDASLEFILYENGKWNKQCSKIKEIFADLNIKSAKMILLPPDVKVIKDKTSFGYVNHMLMTKNKYPTCGIWVEGDYEPTDARYYAATKNYVYHEWVTFDSSQIHALKNTSYINAIILEIII